MAELQGPGTGAVSRPWLRTHKAISAIATMAKKAEAEHRKYRNIRQRSE